jgi:flagellar biosynthesis protein FlhA
LIVLFTPIPATARFPDLTNFPLRRCCSCSRFMWKTGEFSTFPSLLLIATLFRLSLNIGATG